MYSKDRKIKRERLLDVVVLLLLSWASPCIMLFESRLSVMRVRGTLKSVVHPALKICSMRVVDLP